MSFVNQQPEGYGYETKESFFEGASPLPQSVGYAVVLGFGAAFSIFTTILVYLEKYFTGSKGMTSEKFK